MATSFKEFYGQERNVNSVLFPKQIFGCLKSLGIEPDDYILNHSVLPFYRLFLKDGLYKKICEQMLYGKKSYTRRLLTQQSNGAHIKSDNIRYCPVCLKENTGYKAIKIFHQIKGVYVCPEHLCYLNSIPIKSRTKLLQIGKWDMAVRSCAAESVLVQVARDVEYIIDNPPDMDNHLFRECLLDEALNRSVFQYQKWYDHRNDEWRSYYDKLPEEYASFKEKANFRRFASYEIKESIDPIEYLVFIQSLYGSFEKFMKVFG